MFRQPGFAQGQNKSGHKFNIVVTLLISFMSKTEMPAAEVSSYELAFHVLPTVAEGEVADVATALRSMIEAAGGTAMAAIADVSNGEQVAVGGCA